jgi:hypothetical protein
MGIVVGAALFVALISMYVVQKWRKRQYGVMREVSSQSNRIRGGYQWCGTPQQSSLDKTTELAVLHESKSPPHTLDSLPEINLQLNPHSSIISEESDMVYQQSFISEVSSEVSSFNTEDEGGYEL